MPTTEEILQHAGIKGMKWGVRRNRNQPGGADGKDNSSSSKRSGKDEASDSKGSAKGGSSSSSKDGSNAADGAPAKKGFIKTRMDSSKRERDWNKVLKNVNKMSDAEISSVTRRIQLENELKRHSKTSSTDRSAAKKDYLKRADMSDADLAKRVTQLRVKENLNRTVREANDGQQEVGQRVVKAASVLALSYAVNRSIGPKDILAATVVASTANRKTLTGLDKEAARQEVKNDLNKRANAYVNNSIRPK
jgi:hypothetical protein